MKMQNTIDQALYMLPLLEGKTVFFDLDGVLIDATHRHATLPDGSLDLELYRLRSTFENVMLDRPLPFVHLAKALGKEIKIITARPACAGTIAWLKNYGIEYSAIYARQGEGDQRRDYVLKRDHLIDNYTRDELAEAVLFDDNKQNCRMFRELGGLAFEMDFHGH